ncbi:nuclear transport factor 2 family protein [Kordia sp.]|uniref:nuclear transport factor 2 family protein n=1 Tax=Kordia sp. TaxID=1965332 RepID=UPI0025B9BCB1|nr:nuclear transport factor 2 family protein [Kordia sp.]MCH2196312.1 nuclear transport factor 2 family protein [Kordia sp.]
MKFKHTLLLFFSVFILTSCSDNSSLGIITSFVEARNNNDVDKLIELTSENYSETFRNDFVEVKNRKELLRNLEWAKELKSLLTIKEVVSENDAVIIVIEESKNYIDDALKRKPRKFKTTYYLKDGKILKQSFDNAPGEKFDTKANDVLYGDFERYCKVNNIKFSWEPTKEAGIALRKALEKYANRKE